MSAFTVKPFRDSSPKIDLTSPLDCLNCFVHSTDVSLYSCLILKNCTNTSVACVNLHLALTCPRILILISSRKGIFHFISKAVGIGHLCGHFLVGTDGIDQVDGIDRNGEGIPSVANDLVAQGEGHEVVSALLITVGPKTDDSQGAGTHAIVVFFVCLHVGSKLEDCVLSVCKLVSGHYVSRRMMGGDAVGGRKSI